jgi:hypothetical protein
MNRVIGFAVVLAAAFPVTAVAASKAVEEIVHQTITDSCDGPGKIDPAGVIERDFTGDGRPDLLINHWSITCQKGIDGYCGTDGCSMDVHVAGDKGYGPKQDLFAYDIKIEDGSPARITVYNRDGDDYTYRWADGRFR